MAFTIRSSDGRVCVCTYDATAAAAHARRLRGLGFTVRVTDLNGQTYRTGALDRRAAETISAG